MRHLHQRIMERLPCCSRSLFYPTCLIYSPFSIILGYPKAVCPFFIKNHARNDRPWTSYNESSIQGIGYTSWLVPISCILNLGTVWTDSRTTRLYYTWIYTPLWQGIVTCSFVERKNMRQWAQTLTIKGFTQYSFTIQFQLLRGRPAPTAGA